MKTIMNRNTAAVCLTHSTIGAKAMFELLRKERYLLDGSLTHNREYWGSGNKAMRRAGRFEPFSVPHSIYDCQYEYMYEARDQWHEHCRARRGIPTKSYQLWRIEQNTNVDEGFFAPMKAPYGKVCYHDDCSNAASYAHTLCEPDESDIYECHWHYTHEEMNCPQCDRPRLLSNYKSGASLGGCGTMEVFTFNCGHTEYLETDCAANYI